MMKRILLSSLLSLSMCSPFVGVQKGYAHCQMPCGIYHDDMIYDRIDQYIETMVKAMAVLNDNKFSNVKERNEFVRWVLNKDRESDEAAHLILTYFLQQKIKPDEDETAKRVVSAHKMLFLIVAIKQGVDLKCVSEFAEEWGKFKLMFHPQDYECKMNQLKHEERERKEKAITHRQEQVNKAANYKKDAGEGNQEADHDHDHDHDHQH